MSFPVAWDVSASPAMSHSPSSPGLLEVDNADVLLARKLQQEWEDEDFARRISDDDNNGMESSKRHTLDQLHVANGDEGIDPLPIVKGMPITDEELARKVEQEMHDEHLAHHLTFQEARMTATGPRWTARRICGMATSVLIVAAVITAVLLVFSGRSGFGLIGMNSNFAQNDPYFNNTHVIPWNNGGRGGLTLQVVNALDTKWYTEFQKAVYQWDNGNPDALTLSTAETSPDSICSQLMGRLKVCNGNYGATYWLGINEQLIQRGWLISSAARMNDYYLDNAIESQRQYTMCHEIGHGFGLPHTDENFYNADLGNCLDYTIHPWVNEQPAAMNFDLLNKTYGKVGSRRDLAHHYHQVVDEKQHPEWVMPAFSKAVRRLREEGHEHSKRLGWTVAHMSPYGEIHTRHLGADYMAHVHIMFVTNQLPP